MTFSFDSLWVSAAAPMVLVVLKVTVVVLAALVVSAALRDRSASARHTVWLVSLVATLVLPLVSFWSPLPLHLLPAAAPPATRPAVVVESPMVAIPRAQPTRDAASAAVPAAPMPPRALDARAILLAIWSLGLSVLLTRLALGAWMIHRIVRRARPLDQVDWQQPLYEVADRLGLDEPPRLVQSHRIKMPFATGLTRPVIVLPVESAAWDLERRRAVLIHELAHVKRRDLPGHLVGGVACALYWFHPMVWTAARELRAESERAADDLALALGTPPSDYAEHLIDIVTEARQDPMPAVALAMAKPREFEGRILAILDSRRRRRAPGRLETASLISVLTVLFLLVGAVSPMRRVMASATSPASRARSASLDLSRGSTAPQSIHEETHTFVAERTVTATTTTAKSKSKPTETSKTKSSSDDFEYRNEEKGKDKDENADATKASDASQRAQVLAKSLRTDSDVEVRRVAAWGLSRYAGHDVAAKALGEALAKDESKDVREMSAWALADSRNPASLTALEAAFRDKSPDVRKTAAWAAGSIGSRASTQALTTLLTDADPEIREIAAWSIGNCSSAPAPAALVKALGDASRDVRMSVAWALYEIADPGTAEEIDAAYRREKDRDVQRGLIRALGAMGEHAVPALTKLVDSPDPEIRAVAVAALAGGSVSGPWPWPRPEPRPYP